MLGIINSALGLLTQDTIALATRSDDIDGSILLKLRPCRCTTALSQFVSVKPGHTKLTETPEPSISLRKIVVNAFKANKRGDFFEMSKMKVKALAAKGGMMINK